MILNGQSYDDSDIIDAHLTRFHAQQSVSESDIEKNRRASALARKDHAQGYTSRRRIT